MRPRCHASPVSRVLRPVGAPVPLDVLLPGPGAAETVGAVRVGSARLLVVAGILLVVGVLDRLFGVRLFHGWLLVVGPKRRTAGSVRRVSSAWAFHVPDDAPESSNRRTS